MGQSYVKQKCYLLQWADQALGVLVYKTVAFTFTTMEQAIVKRFFQPADPNTPRVFFKSTLTSTAIYPCAQSKETSGKAKKDTSYQSYTSKRSQSCQGHFFTSKENQSILLNQEVWSGTICQLAQHLSDMPTFWLEHLNSRSMDISGLFVN